jgi:hypothetical protein
MTGRRSRRSLWWLLLGLAAASFGFCRAVRDPWPAQQGVLVAAGEERDTVRAVAATVALVNRNHVEGRPFARSEFAKAHACVRASLEVPDLEPRLRHGLFARLARYDAWLRFSNGSSRVASDQRRDAHGLAVKVMGVAGDKLLEEERAADTQDFLLSDSPRFPLASVRAYAELVEALARGDRLAYLFDGSLLPWRWRIRTGWLEFRAHRAPPSSPLQTQYYSGTAYRLGPEQFVKYGVRPCERKRTPRSDRTDDMLRRRLKAELAGGDACLELTVQLQVPGRNMPIEDPTVLWSAKESPFLPVARITIPKQVFDTPEQDRFCEDLSFTPWHALPAHEPVGGLNRLRKVVYREISRYRHARNGTARGEPRGFCLDLTGATCPVAEASASTAAAVSVNPARATASAPVHVGRSRPAAPSPESTEPSPVVAKPGTEVPPPSTAPEAVPTPAPDTERVPPPPQSEPVPD